MDRGAGKGEESIKEKAEKESARNSNCQRQIRRRSLVMEKIVELGISCKIHSIHRNSLKSLK